MARAIFAGILATAIVSALIYLNARTGVLPRFPLIVELQAFNQRLGLPSTTQAAWITHAVVGVAIYGTAFALIEPILPGAGIGEGLVFGAITWLAMMVVFAPLAGHELFLRDLGPIMLAMTFGFHMIYGATLGLSYVSLNDRRA